MPLKSVLDRVFATSARNAGRTDEPSAMFSGSDDMKKAISKAETDAVLRGILREEQLDHSLKRAGEDSPR